MTKGKFAFVSDEDFERVTRTPEGKPIKWQATNNPNGKENGHEGNIDKWYAVRFVTVSRNRRKTVYMHRFLMDAPKGKVVDHLDGNSLNNCRENLRISTWKENNRFARLYKRRDEYAEAS